MPIQFAGVDLLLEDPEGGVCGWLNRYLSLNGMNLFGPTASIVGLRHSPRTLVRQFTSFPVPNYPSTPAPQINSLYWPTGAARWGHGLFLIDDEGLLQIQAYLSSLGGREHPALLKFTDSDVDAETIPGFWMYLLPPRKVSADDSVGAKPLWILPLVDQRYWWQYRQFDGTVSSWEDLFESLRTTLGIPEDYGNPFLDSVNSAYGRPHCIEMRREWDSAAMVLDGACHSIGKRFVLDIVYPEGENRHFGFVRGYPESATILDANKTEGDAAGIVAGGEFSQGPEIDVQSVAIVFPNDDGTAVGDVTHAYLAGEVNGTYKVFHQAANIAVTTSAWRQSLADRVAIDTAGWSERLYDITYAGLLLWRPNGYDDYVEWLLGSRGSLGQYRMQTRAKSMPYNFGVENLANQETDDCPEEAREAWAGIIIESIDYDVVTAIVTFRPCGMSQVPEEYNGRITIYDEMYQCLLNEDDEALIGRRGEAVYGKADPEIDPYAECKWQIRGLCCPE